MVGSATQDSQGNDVQVPGILDLIEDAMLKFQSNKKKSLAILESKMMLMSFKQKTKMCKLPVSTHHKNFKRHAKAHKRNGGGFEHDLV